MARNGALRRRPFSIAPSSNWTGGFPASSYPMTERPCERGCSRGGIIHSKASRFGPLPTLGPFSISPSGSAGDSLPLVGLSTSRLAPDPSEELRQRRDPSLLLHYRVLPGTTISSDTSRGFGEDFTGFAYTSPYSPRVNPGRDLRRSPIFLPATFSACQAAYAGESKRFIARPPLLVLPSPTVQRLGTPHPPIAGAPVHDACSGFTHIPARGSA